MTGSIDGSLLLAIHVYQFFQPIDPLRQIKLKVEVLLQSYYRSRNM